MPVTPTTGPRKLHVGIEATTWPNPRGFGRFTRELVAALAARDSDFRYTLVFDRMGDFDLPAGVDVVCANTSKGLNDSAVGQDSRSLPYLWKMSRLVRRSNFDLFFFPAVYSFFPLLQRVPCVVCYHDATAERIPHLLFPTRWNRHMWRLKTRLAKWQTTRAMTVSRSSARDLENILRIPASKIDLVTEGADRAFRVVEDPEALAGARSRHGIPPDAEVLLTLGGMNAHKNVLAVLKALPGLVSKRPGTHLVVVGDTSGKGFWDNVPILQKFVAAHPPLEKHVHFTGHIGDEEVVNLLGSATALVFPSLWEGFGLPALEAMSCGVPVLASNRGSLPEVVGNAGLFFDPADPGETAATILRLLEDPDLRRQLAAAALQRARGFSWERGAELAEASFRRCLGIPEAENPSE